MHCMSIVHDAEFVGAPSSVFEWHMRGRSARGRTQHLRERAALAVLLDHHSQGGFLSAHPGRPGWATEARGKAGPRLPGGLLHLSRQYCISP